MIKSSFSKKITESIEGEARFDDLSRTVFSSDASIYEVTPLGVVFPKTTADIETVAKLAFEESIPLIPRGAATGITGGCLGTGLIIDLSKYLNKIIQLDPDKKVAICQPGAIQDSLNKLATPYGLRLGPDTSTGNRATLGGMLANNAAGAHSLRYSCMADHVEEVKLILAGGKSLEAAPISLERWEQLAQNDLIYGTCWQLRHSLHQDISQAFPTIPRRVSGYNFPALLDDKYFNLCRLIAGSEGTLGIATEITVQLSPQIVLPQLCLIEFNSLLEAFRWSPQLLKYDPIALEVLDDTIMIAGKSAPAFKNGLKWLKSIPKAMLILEFEGHGAADQAHAVARQFPKNSFVLSTPRDMHELWDLRKAGLGLLMSKRSYSRAIAFLEDIAVPPAQLAGFMEEFLQLLSSENKTAGVYGHAGAGCMHIRPYMDLRNEDDRLLMKKLMLATTDLLIKHQGVLSGEHGDGLVRSWLNEKLFGPKIYQGFVQFKEAFDPRHLMNPHKIVEGPPLFEHLRTHPEKKIETFLDFSRDGGIDLAVDMCNGNGACRKREGVMCPSFQATGDENDTTRARANVLRTVMLGKNPIGDIASQGVQDILDLCISCKGCKKECPSQVDMAKLKAESLYHYHKAHGTPLRSRIFGNIGKLFSWGATFPKLSNSIANSFIGKKILSLLGVADTRPLPQIAPETFEDWAKRQDPPSNGNEKVVLFNDTFTNFTHPEIGKAAYLLLKSLGFEVIVPPWNCCGRTAISKGLLPEAKNMALTLVATLKKYSGLPLVFLEPSCWSALVDDYHDLIKEAIPSVFTLEEFLLEHKFKLISNFSPSFPEVAIHIHCHEKALLGVQTSLKLFHELPGIHPILIDSGCCGMAGSFGFEKEHVDISHAIAEQSLFPFLRKLPPNVPIVANGTSCRTQIVDGTSRKAVHFAEYLSAHLKRPAHINK